MPFESAGQSPHDLIRRIVADTPQALFAVLVGSRAQGRTTESSDWDIAILWQQEEAMQRIIRHETLRHRLAACLEVPDKQIDLIDLANARLAMKALVVEEGVLLHANDELAWAKFMVRTWRELEDFYWERAHAA
jgi:predicted nucleotidyltransferase